MKLATEITDCWGRTSYDSFSATMWVSAPAMTVSSPVMAVTLILQGEKMVTWPVAGASPCGAMRTSEATTSTESALSRRKVSVPMLSSATEPFARVRGIEAALAIGGEAKAGIRDANVGGAADVGADFFAGENAGAFGERALADMSEIRLEHDAKRRVLRG